MLSHPQQARQQAAGSEPVWEKEVMPTLRKRLEAESVALTRRLSQQRQPNTTASTSTKAAASSIPLPVSSRIPMPTSSRTSHTHTKSTSSPPKSPPPSKIPTSSGGSGFSPVSASSPPSKIAQGQGQSSALSSAALRARVKSTPMPVHGLGGGTSSRASPAGAAAGGSSGLVKPGFATGSLGKGRGRNVSSAMRQGSAGSGSGSGLLASPFPSTSPPNGVSTVARPSGTPSPSSSPPSSDPTTRPRRPTLTRSPSSQSQTPQAALSSTHLVPPLPTSSSSRLPLASTARSPPRSVSGSTPRSRTPGPSPTTRRNPSSGGSSASRSPSVSPRPSPSHYSSAEDGALQPARQQQPPRTPSPDMDALASRSEDDLMNTSLDMSGQRESPEVSPSSRKPEGSRPSQGPGRNSGQATLRPEESRGGGRSREEEDEIRRSVNAEDLALSLSRSLSSQDVLDEGNSPQVGSHSGGGGSSGGQLSPERLLDIKDEQPPFLMTTSPSDDVTGDNSQGFSYGGGMTGVASDARERATSEAAEKLKTQKEERVAEALAIASYGHDLEQGPSAAAMAAGKLDVLKTGTGQTVDGRKRSGSLAVLSDKRREDVERGREDVRASQQTTLATAPTSKQRLPTRSPSVSAATASPAYRRPSIKQTGSGAGTPRSASANEFGKLLASSPAGQSSTMPHSTSAFSLSNRAAKGRHYPLAAYAIPNIPQNSDPNVIPVVAKRLEMERLKNEGGVHEMLVAAGEHDLISEWAADGTPLKRVRVEPKKAELLAGVPAQSREASMGVALGDQEEDEGEYVPPTAPGMFNYDASKARKAQQRLPPPIRTEGDTSTQAFPMERKPSTTFGEDSPSSPAPFTQSVGIQLAHPVAIQDERERRPSLLQSGSWGSMGRNHVRNQSGSSSTLARRASFSRQVGEKSPLGQHGFGGSSSQVNIHPASKDQIRLGDFQQHQPWSHFPSPPVTPNAAALDRMAEGKGKQRKKGQGKKVDQDGHEGGCKCIVM